MLMIYQTLQGKFERVTEIAQNCWLQLVAPASSEIDQVVDLLGVPRDFLTDPLDLDEKPRIEQRDEAVLLVIHVPYEKYEVTSLHDDVKYRTIPLGIVLTKDHVITVCSKPIPLMEGLFSGKGAISPTLMKTRMTLELINEASRAYIDFLATIEQAISKAETELAKSYHNRELYTLLYLNESLLYITTSLKQMKYTMQKILHGSYLQLDEAETDLLSDALIELEQAHEVAEISQSNLNSIMDAYGNVIQNNVNRVLKFLAAITIVLSVPTLVASIYGMNVPLPFQDEPHAFSVLIAVMVAISGLFTIVFYKKRYF